MLKSQEDSERDTLKHYLKQIKSLFPVYGKYEKRFLMDFEKSIQSYLESDAEMTAQNAISHFGSPADIMREYMENIDGDDLIKRVRVAQKIRVGVVAVVLIVAIVAATLSVMLYHQYEEAQEALASVVEVEIEEK
jgi:hypothetical protein